MSSQWLLQEQNALTERNLVNHLIETPELSSASSVMSFTKKLKAALPLVPLTILLSLSGCGSNTSAKPQVGVIAFTDANGVSVASVNMLKVGTGIYLDVVVTNDEQLLGVNWTVNCSSALPPGTPLPPGETVDESCGFFTPVHTLSAPVPSYATSGAGIVTFYQAPAAQSKDGTVTLYASSTLDPSRFSGITLSILP